jgi:hypothetical protein
MTSQDQPRSRVHELNAMSRTELIAICQQMFGPRGWGQCGYVVARLDRYQLITAIRDLETGHLPVAA